MNPLVSVVIPAYNAESTIETSTKSILNQTWQNTEVLIVDDGSNDKTAHVVEALAKKDGRIKFIQHEANKGSLTARLTAIKAATGEFITFLDADDYLDANAIETCLAQKNENGKAFDIVQFGFQLHYEKPRLSCDIEWTDNFFQPPKEKRSGKDIMHLIFKEQRACWNLCGKLFNTGIVKKAVKYIPSQKLTMAEDTFVCFVICSLTKTYVGIPELRAYHYNIDSGSSAAVERNLNLQQFEKYCEFAPAMQQIYNYLSTLENKEAFAEDFEAIKNCHVDSLLMKIDDNISEQDRSAAFKMYMQAWGEADAISRLANRYFDNELYCIKRFNLKNFFKPTLAPVKTIGIYYWRLHNGGGEKVTVALANLWQQMGYKVVIFTDEEPKPCDYELDSNISRIVLPFCEQTNNGCYFERAKKLEAVIKQYNIDTIVYGMWMGNLITWDMLLAKSLGVRVIVHAHNSLLRLYSNNIPHEATLSVTYSMADGVIALSDSDKQYWLDRNPNTFKVQNPLTIQSSEGILCSAKKKRIIWVGRLCMGEKCPEEAVKIISYLRELDPEVKLIFVGSYPDKYTRRNLEKVITDLDVSNSIEFVGEVSDVKKEMANASIFLSTARYEGYPLTLTESRFIGLPCVMYELPYLELVKGGRGIISIPQKNAKAAAYAIYDLLNNQAEYKRLSNEAYSHAQELCEYDYITTWKNIFNSLEKERISNGIENPNTNEWDKNDVLALGNDFATKDHVEEVRYLHCEIDARDGRISAMQRELDAVRSDIAEIKNSTSHKLGSAIMALPCKLKDGLRK